MKKILFSALPVAALALFTLKPAVSEPLAIGSSLPSPDVKMKDITGAEVSFNDAKRTNGLLVIFSCNTCPVVQGYQERMNEICKYAMNNNFGVMLLNSNEAYRSKGDSYDDMKGYAKKHDFDWYYVVDKNSAMADIFGANRTPEVFLFDKNSKLSYHGAIDDNPGDADGVSRKHLKLAIDELDANKQVSQKESKSVGCNIKRLS
jgi:AhpC/TSA family